VATVDPDRRVRVWDLPTRLFHWSLVVLVVCSLVTAEVGGNAMEWHMKSGYAVLTLLLFRILWGLAGSRHALFANFVRPPGEILRHVRATLAGTAPRSVGHNPLGAISVLLMVLTLLLQAGTGLFARDDIFNEGPLAQSVSNAASDWLTSVHRRNEVTTYVLVALHVLAVAYYAFVKRDNLVLPMITGDKSSCDAPPAEDGASVRLRALVFLALCAAFVAYIVTP
jgi:cytochrome b